jgi:ABC-2 type transport system ATP-binding protein
MSQFISENSRTHVRVRTPEPERLQDVLVAEGLRPVAGHEGALEVEGGDAARIGELAASHGVVLHELSPQRASLEEAFMRLTAQSVEYHAFAPGDSATPGGGPSGPGGAAGPGGPAGPGGAAGPGEGGPAGGSAVPPGEPPPSTSPGWGQGWKKGGQG